MGRSAKTDEREDRTVDRIKTRDEIENGILDTMNRMDRMKYPESRQDELDEDGFYKRHQENRADQNRESVTPQSNRRPRSA
jgi:hypothetical protein